MTNTNTIATPKWKPVSTIPNAVLPKIVVLLNNYKEIYASVVFENGCYKLSLPDGTCFRDVYKWRYM